jgi:hypothetical protein
VTLIIEIPDDEVVSHVELLEGFLRECAQAVEGALHCGPHFARLPRRNGYPAYAKIRSGLGLGSWRELR